MTTFIAEISDDRYGSPGTYSIERCVSCGHMSTSPRLTEADLPALYSTYYPRRSIDYAALEKEAAIVEKPFASFRRRLAGTNNQGHYLAKRGEKVLDIGCGSCLSLLEMQKLGVNCWGVETDPNVRDIAEKYALQVHIGSIFDTPFPDIKFDLIVLNQVIEHVPDPAAVLATIKGRLAEGGKVALAFPNTDSIYRTIWKGRWINWHIPFHQNHFNKRSFTLLANAMGYNVDSVKAITPNLWTVLQFCVLRERKEEGKASRAWATETQPDLRPSPRLKLRQIAIAAAARTVGFVFGMANRVFDAFGKGDSLLVVLSPKDSRG